MRRFARGDARDADSEWTDIIARYFELKELGELAALFGATTGINLADLPADEIEGLVIVHRTWEAYLADQRMKRKDCE